MGQLSFTISLMIIGLFTIALIAFAVNFAIDNDAPVSIQDDSELMGLKSDSETDVSTFKEKSEDSYKSIVDSSITKGDNLESGGTFSLTISSSLSTVTNILRVGYVKIFGTGSGFGIFLTAFISIILFIAFMYFAKTWLGRNPD